jgi:hypothetical protein
MDVLGGGGGGGCECTEGRWGKRAEGILGEKEEGKDVLRGGGRTVKRPKFGNGT